MTHISQKIKEVKKETKPKKRTHKQRVIDFILSLGGLATQWQIEGWSADAEDISVSSASRRCRELANEGILFHPTVNNLVDVSSWQIKRDKLQEENCDL